MLKASLRKNIFREIRASLTRFIAIFAITALGAGFFAGLKATSPDMKATADHYYADRHLMDYRLLCTMGFTEEDIAALREAAGVQDVMAVWGLDLLVAHPEGDEAARFNALPQDTGGDNPSYLNRPVLTEGRMPEAAGECLADDLSAYRLGEVVTLSPANSEEALELMAETRFTVVGRGRSPSYVSIMRGNTNIGGGSINAFFYLVPEAFDSEYYTDVYLTAAGAAGLSSFSDAYEALTDEGTDALEALGEQRAQLRYNEIRTEADEELADAERELADARAEADEKLAEAEQELLDGDKELADGRREIEENEQKLADAVQQIADGEQALAEAQSAVDAGQTAYNAGLDEYNAQLGAYTGAKAQADALEQGIANLPALVGLLGTMLDPPGTGAIIPGQEQSFRDTAALVMQAAGGAAKLLAGGDAQAVLLAQQIEAVVTAAGGHLAADEFDDAYAQLGALAQFPLYDGMQAAVAGAQAQLAGGLAQLNAAHAQLQQAADELAGGRQQIAAGRQGLEEARAELADGHARLADALEKLAEAEQKLADGRAEYQEEKAKAERELADAQREIDDAREELAELEPPEWIVQTRADNPGYSGFASDTGRIDAIATVIPVFFFLVAALVCLTSMTRMVEEQRTLIGTLKALGYTTPAIAAKFVGYAAFASIAGAVAGVVVGFLVFPWAIWQAYGILYNMAPLRPAGNLPLAVGSVGVSVLCTTLATLAACLNELRSVPANLMRQKAPRAGKRVILERIPLLWRHMGFMAKVTARNLLRYKKRFFMTVIGVSGCTALLVTGFGLRDSISGIVPRQYGGIYHYNIIAVLTDPSASAAGTELNALLPTIGQGLYTREALVDVESDGGKNTDMTTYVSVMEDPEALPQYITLRDRKSGQEIPPPEGTGAVITEKLATRLKVEVGDTIRVNRVNERPGEITVQGIMENYILNYVYVAPEGWQALFGQAPDYNTVLVLAAGKDTPQEIDALLPGLLEAEPVAGAANISAMEGQFTDMFASLDAVVWLVILSAGALAFVVLYNLTNINITERQREIATLKVLGFRGGEVASYVYRENLLLTLIGIAAGLVLGVFLHEFVVSAAEVDEVMFRRVIEPLSYGYSVVFTLLTAGLVNLVMLRRLRGVDMVESLKSME